MSVNENAINNKTHYSNMKSAIYFSPYAHKKKVIGNLYTEPRKMPIQTDSTYKNKTKPKISNPIIRKNIINFDQPEFFRKSSKFLSQMNDKSYQSKKNEPESYKKINSKLYLKKNVIPNLSSFNEINNKVFTSHLGSNSNMNTEFNISRNNKLNKNKPGNIKFNLGKNNSNNYTSAKESSHFLKKSAGSATELFGNNMIKKTKTKQKNNSDLNNINISPIGYILTTKGSNNKAFLSPQNGPGQKIIFLKNENNKIKDKYIGNISKDSVKVIQTQGNEQINNNNLDDKNKNGIQYLLRNTYNNVKIYPTTFLNNKIIYQTENNNDNINNNDSNNNSMCLTKNKSEKLIINNNVKKGNLNTKKNYENAKSIEEVHFLYVRTIQNGKNLILKWDKCNN